MDILFIIDRVELKYFEFNDLVTNFWLIKEFLEKDQKVHIATIDMLSLASGVACARCNEAYLKDGNLFYNKEDSRRRIEDFQLVMFRPDPPVDMDYINATYVLDFVDREKTVIMNDPRSVRDFNEKLHAVLFNDLMPNNIVTSSKADILEFLDICGEIVIKPLNRCFGAGVMCINKGDKNTLSIINSLTNNQTTMVMVQKYIPAAVSGDKRIMFLGDQVLDVCIQKLPGSDDFKFNQHCDSNLAKATLSESEKQKFSHLAKTLNSMGLPLVGLDVIDEQIIEINVTSPCYFIKEVNNHFGIEFQKQIVDFILSRVSDQIKSFV